MNLFNNINKNLSNDEKINKIKQICSINTIKPNDIIDLFNYLDSLNSQYSRDMTFILKCMIIVTEKTIPDKNMMLSMLHKILFPYHPAGEKLLYFNIFINNIFEKGYNFSPKEIEQLSKTYFQLDSIKTLNKKISKQMLPLLFTNLDINNLENIKKIIKKNNIKLDKKCLNHMLNKIYKDCELIKYIELFSNNNYIFDEKEIIKILYLSHTYLNMNNYKQKTLLNIICNGKLSENIIIKLISYSTNLIINILKIYNEKIKISKNNLKKIIIILSNYNDNYIKNIIPFFDLIEFTIDSDIIQFSKMFSLSVNPELINYFESKYSSNIQEVELNPESKFIEHMENCDINNIKKMIDNKFIPKSDYLYYLLPNKDNNKLFEIVSLFTSLNSVGITITDEIYYYLHMIGIKKLDTLDFPKVSSELKDNINNNNYKKFYNDFDINSIQDLRKLFRIGNLKQILMYELTNLINCEIKPDSICFLNALKNDDMDVTKYVISKYNYKPSIFDILTVNNMGKRVYLFKRYYPNQNIMN
jgi:hypothetical protein